MADKKDIWIYAHWKGMDSPTCIGILSAHQAKGRKAFSFTYDESWVASQEQILLDPDIAWYNGQQFPNNKENFGVFLDSMPDTWGKTTEKVAGKYHTFFTKRFDREKQERIHFASAMTMIGQNEELVRDSMPSYLDMVEFIQFSGTSVTEDLHQLWRRLIFTILISNTDDHLRNHGFILTEKGWRLSPAFDINPSVDKNGLSLNVDLDNNSLDLDLAKSVGIYFRLTEKEMNAIIDEVKSSISNWQKIATETGISRSEQGIMRGAFRI